MRTASVLFLLSCGIAQAQSGFALHDGDRVVFYGDSITEQSLYPNFVETLVRTRYPSLRARFWNAGVGGDRVTGGWMGPIDQRLTKDLFPYKPTVVTIMLGMNDASYKPFDAGIMQTYETGYQHILRRIKTEDSGARVWLIKPSPYDDITRAPGWDPGYNSVLLRYSEYLQTLAGQTGAQTIDLNAPVVEELMAAKAVDPTNAQKILPDRVHPGPSGHLVMAWAVAKAWGMSPDISTIRIDATKGPSQVDNASVRDFRAAGALSWSERENSLPFPIDRKDTVLKLALDSDKIDEQMNREMLAVAGLTPGQYTLTIDGQKVGAFSDQDLAGGLNLATMDTPMLRQAVKVSDLVWKEAGIRMNTWRNVTFPLQDLPLREKQNALRAMDSLEAELTDAQYAAAKPMWHKYRITAG